MAKIRSSQAVTRVLNACISSNYEAQVSSARCNHYCQALSLENSMASRRGTSQAKEDEAIIRARIASERARLQAVADANRKKIAQAKREREEAEAAKVVADAAAKAARRKNTCQDPDSAASVQVPAEGSYLCSDGSNSAESHFDATETYYC